MIVHRGVRTQVRVLSKGISGPLLSSPRNKYFNLLSVRGQPEMHRVQTLLAHLATRAQLQSTGHGDGDAGGQQRNNIDNADVTARGGDCVSAAQAIAQNNVVALIQTSAASSTCLLSPASTGDFDEYRAQVAVVASCSQQVLDSPFQVQAAAAAAAASWIPYLERSHLNCTPAVVQALPDRLPIGLPFEAAGVSSTDDRSALLSQPDALRRGAPGDVVSPRLRDSPFHRVVAGIGVESSYNVLDIADGTKLPADAFLGEFAVGRWDENRENVYTSDIFYQSTQGHTQGQVDGGAEESLNSPPSSSRTVHMGCDLFAPAGTPVHTFFDGEVCLTGHYPGKGDYGFVVVLRHAIGGQQVGQHASDHLQCRGCSQA